MTKQTNSNSLIGGTLGMKTMSIEDMDVWLDWKASGGGDLPQDLYKAVAWVFWCVNLRANAVTAIPYGIYPKDTARTDFTEENEVEYDFDLRQYIWTAEAWLLLKAAAYWLKMSNSVIVKDLKILNSNTMEVWEWDADGPTVFKQTVGADHRFYSADEIVYFRTFNSTDDIKEGVASGRVSTLPALLIQHSNEFAESFFRNGAVPLTLLKAAGVVPQVEQDRIKAGWKQLLQGVKRAWSTVLLQKGMDVEVIGQPIKDLAMPELDMSKKHQILAAHMIPPGYAEAKTNRAERWALQFELYTDAIIPECENYLIPVIDEQLLNEQGLRIGFRYHEIEALQRAELQKAESASFMWTGVMGSAYDKNLVSVDESRAVIDALLQMSNLPKLDDTFVPEPRVVPLALAASSDEEDTPPGGGDAPGAGTPPGKGATDPKASAPEWGHLRASLQNLAGGETKQPSADSRVTLTAT